MRKRWYVTVLLMPTSRPLALLLVAALLGGAGLAEIGCATDTGDDTVAGDENELGESATAAGIKAGSLEEEGVLLLVNDREVTLDVLKTRTKVSAAVASGIIAFRTTPEGDPRWFSTIDEVDAIPQTGTVTFQRLVADAKTSGYVEAPGFDAPTLAKISVPENLGRPPTANDVVVEAGFDGMPAADAAKLVRARLTNTVMASKESFVGQTIKDTHKAFTLAVSNLFAQGSPHAAFVQSLGAEKLTMLGTMSSLKPTILVAEKAGATTYYARGASGRYESIAVPTYPVIMRAKIRLATAAADDPGQGVRVFYPAWSAKVLSGVTSAPDASASKDASADANKDAGPAKDAGSTKDAGVGSSDAGSPPDGGTAGDAASDPGTSEGSTTIPAVDEQAPADESSADPMAEPNGDSSETNDESPRERSAPPVGSDKNKSAGDAGGCSTSSSSPNAPNASSALLVGIAAAFASRRRRR